MNLQALSTFCTLAATKAPIVLQYFRHEGSGAFSAQFAQSGETACTAKR